MLKFTVEIRYTGTRKFLMHFAIQNFAFHLRLETRA